MKRNFQLASKPLIDGRRDVDSFDALNLNEGMNQVVLQVDVCEQLRQQRLVLGLVVGMDFDYFVLSAVYLCLLRMACRATKAALSVLIAQ